MTDSYLAPAGEGRAEIKRKGSRFVGRVVPVADEEVARRALEDLRKRFPGASHHCWAWRLGAMPAERGSDDGEPAGTAGVPILQVLRGAGLSDVMVVVVRWFGGTKLGKGGLARAYAAVTREALAGVQTLERAPSVTLVAEIAYAQVGAVKRLVRPPEVELVAEEYGETARLSLVVYRRVLEEVAEGLAAIGAITVGMSGG